MQRSGVIIALTALVAWGSGCDADGIPNQGVRKPARPLSAWSIGQRQHLWAGWQSWRVRAAQIAQAEAQGPEARRRRRDALLRKYRRKYAHRNSLLPSQLTALIQEGNRQNWSDSVFCGVRAPDAVHRICTHAIPPEPRQPLQTAYTREACRKRVEGVVIVDTVVNEDGQIQSARILKGLPAGLSEKVRATMLASRWYPALLCGQPVTVAYTLTQNFQVAEGCQEGHPLDLSTRAPIQE